MVINPNEIPQATDLNIFCSPWSKENFAVFLNFFGQGNGELEQIQISEGKAQVERKGRDQNDVITHDLLA